MYYVSYERYSTVAKYSISVEKKSLEDAYRLLSDAKKALMNREYSKFYGLSLIAWSLAYDAYVDARNTITDVISAVPFFALLLIPFTFLLERLMFSSVSINRIIGLIGIFLCFFISLYFVHPGFALASNVMMVVIGFLVLVLSFPIISILFGMFISALRRITIKIRGIHFAEMSRGSAAILAFWVGIENMKKRKLRTTLTFFTIVIMVVALTMFTSVQPISVLKPVITSREPRYQGIFLNRIESDKWSSLSPALVEMIRNLYHNQSLILPRSWLYTAQPSVSDVHFKLEYRKTGRVYPVYAVLGMSPQETDNLPLSSGSRPFTLTDKWACIITKTQANYLGIQETDEELPIVSLNGVHNFTVVGIIPDEYLNLARDLGGDPIIPADARAPSLVYALSYDTLIIPFNTSLLLGARIVSVSLMFKESSLSEIDSIARNLSICFRQLSVNVGLGDITSLYTYGKSQLVIGWQMQLIPLALSCLMILNLMIGVVHERLKEIYIYSTLGLSPLHISFMFFAESAIYAVIGGILGYVGASLAYVVLNSFYPGVLPVNFSSGWVSTSIGVAMGVTILSVIYPMLKVSRLVTPSLERVWKPPTKPGQREWFVPLPFVFLTEDEGRGACAFLEEFLKSHITKQALEDFSLSILDYNEGKEEGRDFKRLDMEGRLPPYERGIKQTAQLSIILDSETQRWTTELNLKRISGERRLWIKSNHMFIDSMRKQLLLWRGFSPERREEYIKERGKRK